jgi:hypothetical protein
VIVGIAAVKAMVIEAAVTGGAVQVESSSTIA